MPAVVEKVSKKASKNAYRRAKKRAKREETPSQSDIDDSASEAGSLASEANSKDAPNSVSVARSTDLLLVDDIQNEYDLDNPLYEQYKNVFLKFQQATEEELAKDDVKPDILYGGDDIPDEEDEQEAAQRMSRKAKKALNTPSVAQLKAMVQKPELVEWTDVSSSDPLLLVEIKGTKNVIPVPSHWSLKREYLSSKRGIEKPAFSLPKFIQETGISEMRDALLEKQADMTLKQKQRERVQGKTGKMDIDYHKLYDAFFRRQTKPEMTRYGEVYYEGKEYETNLKHLKPGELSDELKDALGMAPGGPPPWLINQQRFGPPPSYPNLKIAGVNAPLPPGASWGYQPGQYGKPPTDDNGRPLFGGDFHGFADLQQPTQPTHPGEPVERGSWGELRAEGESDDESEEEDEDDEEAEEEGDEDMSGIQTSVTTASGFPSEIGGTESIGGEFTLRKQRKGIETEEPRGPPRSAYQVLPEKNVASTGFYGSERTYDLDAARRDQLGENRKKRKVDDVEVSVDLDALADNDTLSKDALRKQYEAQKKAETQGQWQAIDQDDLNEMILEQSRKRVKKEEEKRGKR
ncbi:splicing factor 3b [Dendryphion nanum]|uniref:Splicing factor 3b n=1 Tax=Dendryphion nanum TaxID=256645 RepID=A0A9P9IA59_9PLEO|nr:splicing factor 3b [Dendryphion nanum]